MKLVACPQCHAQYDADRATGPAIACPCGASVPAEPPAAKDAAVTRCAACGALIGETERTCTYCRAEVIRRPAPFGPVCPECYARNPETARFCVSCGVAFCPQPVRTRSGSLSCPSCASAALTPRSLGGIWVEECPFCLGLWTPGDVMDRLVERIRERLEREGAPAATPLVPRKKRSTWQAEVAYRKCPECGAVMQRRNFGRRSGVVVDWCGSHGTWLDTNELEDIAAFVLEGGLRTEPGGASGSWALAVDPNRMAALAAAERIMAEARERTRSDPGAMLARMARSGSLRGIGDLFALLLRPGG